MRPGQKFYGGSLLFDSSKFRMEQYKDMIAIGKTSSTLLSGGFVSEFCYESEFSFTCELLAEKSFVLTSFVN